MAFFTSSRQKVWAASGLAVIAGILLFGVGAIRNHSWEFWYLPYNLALALIPLGLAFWLLKAVRQRGWTDWRSVILAILFVLFLPNSFYVFTDFVHLNEYRRTDVIQDIVMIMQFAVLGLLAGFAAVFMVHRELLKAMKARMAFLLIGSMLLLCSFGMYLGRELRWNSWDIVVQPVLLFADIISCFTSLASFLEMATMTLGFFIMLASLYLVLWFGLKHHENT